MTAFCWQENEVANRLSRPEQSIYSYLKLVSLKILLTFQIYKVQVGLFVIIKTLILLENSSPSKIFSGIILVSTFVFQN